MRSFLIRTLEARSHHTQALSKERTRDNGDLKRVLVKCSSLTIWNTGVVRSAGAADGESELRRIEFSSRTRWVPILPLSIGTVTKASSHDGGEAQQLVRWW